MSGEMPNWLHHLLGYR